MGERAKVVHSIQGRIRVKVPGAKRKPSLLSDIRKSLPLLRGVHHVTIQPAANGFIVQYSDYLPADFHDTLAEHGRSSGLFDLAPPVPGEIDVFTQDLERDAEFLASRSELARSVVNATKSLNLAIKKATNNNVDLKVLLPLGLAAYTILEYGVEASTPLWVTLGIFSFNSFVALHPPLPDTPEGAHHRRPLAVDIVP